MNSAVGHSFRGNFRFAKGVSPFSITPPPMYTPRNLYPPRPSECFAKICTPLQPCASRQDRLKTHSLNTIVKVIYLALAEAWATAAEVSAPAPSKRNDKRKTTCSRSQPKIYTPQKSIPPGPIGHPVKICTTGYTFWGGGYHLNKLDLTGRCMDSDLNMLNQRLEDAWTMECTYVILRGSGDTEILRSLKLSMRLKDEQNPCFLFARR